MKKPGLRDRGPDYFAAHGTDRSNRAGDKPGTLGELGLAAVDELELGFVDPVAWAD